MTQNLIQGVSDCFGMATSLSEWLNSDSVGLGLFTMASSNSSASIHSPLSRPALKVLASHFDSYGYDVRLLRLRLRFGSPRAIASGVAFRIVVDLVDEMAQPPTSALASSLKAAMDVNVKLDAASECGYELVSCRKAPVSGSSLQWRIDCVVTTRPAPLTPAPGVRLRVYGSSHLVPVSLTASHALLQSFCVGSHWIVIPDPESHILVLPVVSDQIQVMPPAKVASLSAQASSSLCLREFAVPSTSVSASLQIEEDYGEAMGSHIWDASIWLSLALIASSSHSESNKTEPLALPFTMLELGAGCGLFAAVFARLARTHWTPFRMILTEKGNSIARIIENLKRNDVASDQEAVVRELTWGMGTIDVDTEVRQLAMVFAADVLYHWSAHEALLATLDDLVAKIGLETPPVLIAHKHRGLATTARLEGVLSQGHDAECELVKTSSHASKCRWSQWQVERIARIANIDVLQLTRKKN